MAQIINKTVIHAMVTLLALFTLASANPANAQTTPDRDQLLNGLTILYGNRPGEPNVLLKLRIHSGAAFDLAGKSGTMALLGDALFPDSSTKEYVAEQLGGQLDVSTTYDFIDVSISGKSSELERMIELLRNAILNLNLSPETVATLREARVKQLSEKPLSGSAAADRAVLGRLFGSYPYGSPAEGTIETLGKIDRADLMLARERFLNADNATLAVVGGVERARLIRALRQLLGPWRKGDSKVPATFRQPGAVDDRVLVIDQPGTNSVQIRLALRGLSRSDSDAAAAFPLAFVANQRWRTAVPELLNPDVRVETHALSGVFMFAATAPPASAAKAIAAAKKIMTDLAQSPPTEAEIPSSIPMSKGTSAEVAYAWLEANTYKLPSNASSDVRIRPDDIRRLAARLFGNSAPLAIVVVGNGAELQTQLGYRIELRTSSAEPKPTTTPSSPPKKP